MPDANVPHVAPPIAGDGLRRAFGAGLALLLAASLAACSGNGPPPSQAVNVIAAKPLKRQIVDWDDFVGHFEAVDSVDVRPRVSGYLQSIGFRDGRWSIRASCCSSSIPGPTRPRSTRPRARRLTRSRRNQRQYRAGARQKAAGRRCRSPAGLSDAARDPAASRGRLSLRPRRQWKAHALNLGFTTCHCAHRRPRLGPARRARQSGHRRSDDPDQHHRSRSDPLHLHGPESLYLKYQSRGQRESGTSSSSRSANPVEIRLQDETTYR